MKLLKLIKQIKTKSKNNESNLFCCKHLCYEEFTEEWHCDIKQRYLPDSDLNEWECRCYNGMHPCSCHSMKRPEHKKSQCTAHNYI